MNSIANILSAILRHDKRLITLADQALVSGSNFLLGMLLARIVGVEGYGNFTAAYLVLMLAASVSQAMVIMPMMSLTPAKSDRQTYLSDLLSLQVLLTLSLAALSFFIVPLISGNIKGFAGMEEFRYALPIMISGFLLQDHLRREAITIAAPAKALLLDIIVYVTAFAGISWLALSGQLTAVAGMYCVAAGFLISITFGLFSHPGMSWNPSSISSTFQELISYSKWLIGTALLQFVSGQGYAVLTGALLGPVALGAFRLALQVLGLLHVVYQAAENHVPVSAARLLNEKGRARMFQYLSRVVILGMTANALALCGIALFRSSLFHLFFGPEQVQYAWLLPALVPAYFLIPVALGPRIAARTLKSTSTIFLAYVLGALFTLCSAHFLIGNWALHGAAIGLAINQLIMVLAQGWPFRKEFSSACLSFTPFSVKPTHNG